MFAGNTACIIAGLPKNATGPAGYSRTLWSLYAKLRRLLQQVHLFLPVKKQSAHSPLFRPCAPDGYFFILFYFILFYFILF
jgi:hypothetical protein